MRVNNRPPNELRPITILRKYIKHAEGSALIKCGNTHVLCTASVVAGVPKFLRDKGQGWVTAEYGMLPRATHTRSDREAIRGKQTGRSHEIQRLIGRSLRSAIDLSALGENTITIDCDVLQADGSTRTTAITGAWVALVDAVTYLQQKLNLTTSPLKKVVAAVSVGIYNDVPVLDLDYNEDCNAATDMNVVMTNEGKFIEIQGTAERDTFSQGELNSMLELAQNGIQQLFTKQLSCIKGKHKLCDIDITN